MNGYINYLTAPQQEEEAEEPIETPEVYDGDELYPATEVVDKLGELESKLQQFKSTSTKENYDPVTTQKPEFAQEVLKTTT
jgi:hypothetical protein